MFSTFLAVSIGFICLHLQRERFRYGFLNRICERMKPYKIYICKGNYLYERAYETSN